MNETNNQTVSSVIRIVGKLQQLYWQIISDTWINDKNQATTSNSTRLT